ncbi:MAG: tetratricopeptide repeat protein [Pseudomonadota bacterium]
MFPRILRITFVILSCILLVACETAEERAQAHFEKGTELYEAGDIPRAIIEMRNVFKLDTGHLEARMLMAQIEEDRDNERAAYGQYLAAVEIAPDHFPAQYAAARLAGASGDWEAAERHLTAATGLAPDADTDPVLRAVGLGVAYQAARRDGDLALGLDVSREAADLLDIDPSLMIARQIVINDSLLRQDWDRALADIDAAIVEAPDDRFFYDLRLALLGQVNRTDEIEAQLRSMIDRFEDDPSLHQTLVQWYVTQERIDDAEAHLRTRIDTSEDPDEARLMLIDFIIQARGADPALAEIDRILADIASDNAKRGLYRAARASLVFEQGDRESGIAEMQLIIDTAAPSDETRRIKLALANMFERTGSPVGARTLVEEVLQEDPTNVDALMKKAAWLIEGDQPDEALVELRRALDQAPRNPELFSLMARAQERAGSRDLMGEMLAMAVEVSNSAPAESLRYADFLVQDDRPLVAESILVGALRLRPGDLSLLDGLGTIYVRLEDWARAQDVIRALERDGSSQATTIANALTVRLLAGQNRQEELRALLGELTALPETGNQAMVATIRLFLADDDVAGAFAFLEERLAETPDDPDLRFIFAGLYAVDAQPVEAREILRSLLEEFPTNERVWLSLYNLSRRQFDQDQADEVLTEALAVLPESTTLNWVLASERERQGDIPGAIEIYEELYARNTNSPVIANNLASLISSFQEDEESLRRAYAIARRLRGTEVPQFQDTYGWIVARLGNHGEALEYLEPAAAALSGDPVVQFHLARTYDLAGEGSSALEAYRTTLALIEASARALPFRDEVLLAITRLETEEGSSSN